MIATIGGAFGLFYAYAVWNAIGNLTQTVQDFSAVGLGLNALGWFLWIFAAAFPVLVWAAAFAIGYRRAAHHFALVMLTGLALVAVFWLNVISYATLNTTALVG
ncbi:bacitracin resistance protein [Microbacterium hominis]|uniref:Bacitracin resistance protein n=1 Tax=Microbacterium hominis TaxID=162426 RepID=A0A7D4UJH0_9MICO|nr:bacitracin resistance protein [Microbacterium hominis]